MNKGCQYDIPIDTSSVNISPYTGCNWITGTKINYIQKTQNKAICKSDEILKPLRFPVTAT